MGKHSCTRFYESESLVPSQSSKVGKSFNKRWKHLKMELPVINVLLRKIKERKLVFHPTPYLEDEEQYFGNLQSWKINFEKQYLQNIHF